MGYLRRKADSFDMGLLLLALVAIVAGGLVVVASGRSPKKAMLTAVEAELPL
jgi:hypothetical protein